MNYFIKFPHDSCQPCYVETKNLCDLMYNWPEYIFISLFIKVVSLSCALEESVLVCVSSRKVVGHVTTFLLCLENVKVARMFSE